MSGKLYIAKLRYKKTQVKYFGAQENISRSFQNIFGSTKMGKL